MFEQVHIGFIGGGNMGEALIRGLLKARLVPPERVHVCDVSKSRTAHLAAAYGVSILEDEARIASSCGIVVIAVKPQNVFQVLERIRDHLAHRPLIVSIAAGVSLSSLVEALPAETPVVRVMPNTPALVLQGASALARSPCVADLQMAQALALFKAVGIALEVEEQWMDAVTGLSGSGPAYILLVLESLVDGGVLMGLPRAIARDLVVQTALGTAAMLRETGKHPAELKDLVTSPGGTTIHGLQVLEDSGIRGGLMTAVQAAALRSRQLGKNP